MDLHLEKLILERVKEKKDLSQAELARKIGSSRQKLYFSNPIRGFIIFCFSDFGGTVALGMLTSITLILSMLTNLTLLPILILNFY